MKSLTKTTLAMSFLLGSLSFSTSAMATKDVVVAIPYSLSALDPYNTNSTLAQAVGKGWYEGLFEFDKDLNIKPLLATEYKASEDGLEYTFKLREGVKFHDGTDFNAEAVKINFERVLNKANALARYNQFNKIKSVEVVNPYEVKIILSEPFSAL